MWLSLKATCCSNGGFRGCQRSSSPLLFREKRLRGSAGSKCFPEDVGRNPNPKHSMYAIFSYVGVVPGVNVGIYICHTWSVWESSNHPSHRHPVPLSLSGMAPVNPLCTPCYCLFYAKMVHLQHSHDMSLIAGTKSTNRRSSTI